MEQAEGGRGLQFYTPGDKPTNCLSQSLSHVHMNATSDSIQALYPTIASARPTSYQFQLSCCNLQGNELGVDPTQCKTACHKPEARMSAWPPYL